MKRLRHLLAGSSFLVAGIIAAHAANITPAGYANDFAAQPPASDWSTFSISGAVADITDTAAMDSRVQQVSASTVSAQLGASGENPPAASATAMWSSTGGYIQTRPTGNAASVVMLTLVNQLNVAASSVTLSYDFAKAAPNTEEIVSHRVYYSLSGAPGSWIVIPQLNNAVSGSRPTVTLTFNWPQNSSLYILWADDNDSPSPDVANQIDNFSATATPAAEIPASFTTHPQSQTIAELAPVSFSVSVAGYPVPTIQWYSNNVAIPGATNSTHEIASAPYSLNGATFKAVANNVASNVSYSVTSSVATLTVNADTVSPVLLGAAPSGLTRVIAFFSEPVSSASGTNLANFNVTGPGGSIILSNIVLDTYGTNAIITVSPMAPGTQYTLTVNNVTDRSAAANQIAANSQAQFVAAALAYADIGNPALAGNVIGAGNGFNIVGGGTNIAGIRDQFTFTYEQVAGDFNLRVRVEGLSSENAYAKVGLMARETLEANSRFAAALATPSISGSFFMQRATVGGSATFGSSVPVNYPYTWLRLQRAGNVFTAFAGYDGQTWVQLGSATITMPSTIYLGFAAAAVSTTQPAIAQVRDRSSAAGGTVVSSLPLPFEPLGPSSRRTGLVISEIMYHPRANNDGRTTEFIELHNSQGYAEDISGFRIAGAISYTFPTNTSIPAGGFLVLAKVAADVQAVYGLSGVLEYGRRTYTTNGSVITTNIANSLENSSGLIELYNRAGARLLEIEYGDLHPFPVAADGGGHSLVLARPSYGENDPRAWAASDSMGGSPGRPEGYGFDPARAVLINEILANTDEPQPDYIELYNYGNTPVNISGCILTDNPATNKFRIPNGTVLPARGFIVFDQTQLGFGLSASGERVFLINSNQTRVLDSVAFEAQANGVSLGRYPDGAPLLRELRALTPGTTNAPLLQREIVINEIMYNPITRDDNEEFVELYNRGTNAVNLGGWRFVAGISYTIPANTLIQPGGYVVVSKNAAHLRSLHPDVPASAFVGNYGGTLANGGERVALAMPDFAVTTNNNGQLRTNINYVVVNEVRYEDGGRWSRWADGSGSSLELTDPNSDNTLAANWLDSDETSKSLWTTIDFTGPLDLGRGDQTTSELQVMLLGRGECLLDDLQVIFNGQDRVPNGNFNTFTGWIVQGNHVRSSWSSLEGGTFYLRASSGGDNGVNRAKIELPVAITSGTVTIRGRAKWLRGHPDVLLRLYGNYAEALGTMAVPRNLGSPGKVNSRRVANKGPAIADAAHSPVLPAASAPVVVSARVHDSEGVASVQLRYRIDPSATLTTVNMLDNGTGGDLVAGDGIYSATIPGQSAGTLAAFHSTAADLNGNPASSIFPTSGEALVRWGETQIPGNLGIYRLWMTASNINVWSAREKLSNEPLDGTLVYNDYRAIYNASGRFRGSPWIRPGYDTPTGRWCAYIWNVPDDDMLLGANEINLDSLEPSARDSTQLREPISFWMADQLNIPYSYQRFIHVVINGVNNQARGVPAYADVHQPNGDYLESWYPNNSDGEIYKIDDWFEFTDGSNPGKEGWNENGRLVQYISQGQKKKARYRWSWEKKSNGLLNDDYGSLFALVDALTAPDARYVQLVEGLMDAEQVLTASALRHAIGDWDGWTYDRGKNEFLYLPNNSGKWQLLLWDLDFSLGCTGGHGPQQNLFQVEGGETTVTRMLNHPHFRRIYLRALQRIADGPMNPANSDKIIAEYYGQLLANNINTVSPYVGSGAQGISIPAWISQRRTYILSQLPAANFALTSPTTVTVSSNSATITGTAPINIKTILINGVEYPVTWTSVTAWSVRVPLQAASGNLAITGTDLSGNVVTPTLNVTANYTGPAPNPDNSIVFNEIMAAPLLPNSDYIELFNTSSNFTFDLSGWRINGLGYTFPPGSYISPRSFIVLAKERNAFARAYGTTVAVFDEFPGTLQGGGERLTLFRPGAAPGEEIVVDRVRYETALPWPAAANNTGSSLQLIDANQENARVGNWFSAYVPPVYSGEVSTPARTNDGWRFVSVTGSIGTGVQGGMRLLMHLGTELGTAIIDDVSIVAGTEPEVGYNYVRNGDFESPLYEDPMLTNSWHVGTNYTNSIITSDVTHSGNGALLMKPTTFGNSVQITSTTTNNRVIYQMLSPAPAPNSINTLSFWYFATNSATNLTVRIINSAALRVDPTNINITITPSNYIPPTLISPATNYLSPGLPNQATAVLPAFPTLWLNEVQADNATGIQDNNGEREPWVEIYNDGTNAVSLDGLYLSSSYTNLTEWAFPSGRSIPAGGFLVVYCDGQPEQTTAGELHTSFRLSSGSGGIALSRMHNGEPQVLDYITYGVLGSDRSYGSFPDGQPFARQEFFYVTPGAPNDGRSAPIVVFINEWMASNTSFIRDPADLDFDDWFELYNPTDNDISIAGYYLTDTTADKRKYLVTTNGAHIVPARGFLLVWADNETGQNMSGGLPREDLHVNFALAAGGEQIGLYAADGTQIDFVSFEQQTNNVSQGRYPDGSPNIHYMTTPTPRAPNYLPGMGNHSPSLAAIGAKTVFVNQALSFQASATDPDPDSVLTYSLDAGAPEGASINSNSGAFTWTPSVAGTFSVTVRVTDNGSPPMSAFESVSIRVLNRPGMAVPTRNGDNVTLAWQAAAGRSYQVQYKNDLSDTEWTNFGSVITANEDTVLSVNALITDAPRRFYRLIVVQP